MLVPEATVHEDDFLSRWEGEVGFAWEVAPMEPESKSQPVCNSPNNKFR